VDFAFVSEFPEIVTLASLREESALEGMLLLQKGTRLSITPVLKKHFDHIVKMSR